MGPIDTLSPTMLTTIPRIPPNSSVAVLSEPSLAGERVQAGAARPLEPPFGTSLVSRQGIRWVIRGGRMRKKIR